MFLYNVHFNYYKEDMRIIHFINLLVCEDLRVKFTFQSFLNIPV